MHLVAAKYASNNKISIVADGYNSAQYYFPEQSPEFRQLTNKFIYDLFSITSTSPLYHVINSRNKINQLLNQIKIEPKLLDRENKKQAICSLGGCFKPPFNKTSKSLNQFKQEVAQYTQEKINIIKSGQKIIQKREEGSVYKPSYLTQVSQAVNKAITINP